MSVIPKIDAQSRAPSTAEQAPRTRNREKTLQELRYAVQRVKSSGQRISISAVAREAGVVPSLIHNTYPDIAEEVRAQVGRTSRQQRDEKAADLAKARELIRELRKLVAEANCDITRLASINETLRDEVARLKAAATGKLVILTTRVGK
nr:TetR family transcriptional regulator [uncultured Albidiferax sp.]